MTHLLLEFHVDAAEELEVATAWYALRSTAAAEQFVEEVDRALATIAESPDRWPTHLHGTRRYLLKRFPFLVVYRHREHVIQIIACAHGRRRPGYWQSRLEPE